MARYQFNDEAGSGGEWLERGTRFTQLVVRGFGLVLMVIGLWIALGVLSEAWSLYKVPANIERFALAIEEGSHLDATLTSARRELAPPDEAVAGTDGTGDPPMEPPPAFRLSYFAAWVLAILILMLVGRLAIAAIKAGGELVLYDVHIKRFARELVRESLKVQSTTQGR